MTSFTPLSRTLHLRQADRPSPSPRKRRLAWILLLAATALPIRALAADIEGPKVSVIAATAQVLEQSVLVVGTIVARETTLVNTDLSGARIVSIAAEEGDLVSRGQVLATLDTSRIDVELQQNDAQAASAAAQLGQASSALDNAMISQEEAEADLIRAQKLVPKGLMSQEALEQRQKALARAEVSVRASRQAVQSAEAAIKTVAAARKDIELRLSYTRIVAPSAGRIIHRSAKVGATASSSSEQLFIIANDDQFELEAEIPQAQFDVVPVGAVAHVRLDDNREGLTSAVRFVAPALADRTRLGRARIALPPGLTAPIGALASARIQIGSSKGIFLPASAIVGTGEEPSIKILRDNRIERKPVLLGWRQAGFIQIRSGVNEGDLVVAKAGGFLEAGEQAVPIVVQADASLSQGN
ncbi:efflux RND transporter periplasmic adaptor subunit [Rhizobium lentis]|uniref:efflux RND transporter periplasmic adaptor subunit n=1 Tax=Rhizobium lentis TaxID=1138194 RepID=UPI001C839EE3|nr:efflux RND transporter periplasmic adaptor subunit [Rhizobium lentis]MBX4955246.1 efflux RND transporter periplasmic adaptor subunit [Rhizobium lentis]MBX4987029.1 efflux RND transporter periplasmic adaptor subunit [Rhizobium lentis]MBX5005473.1 efflux RND transporter periplasmic adaptor subunit [Rhizobium lentis]MBX5028583.1 efflux RND transporter periplasmic adaptor subunit [Rhizobium lentis]MBX5034026.1 efflux RND transporter periplasmic adaptor subunit [Rhizobium lentis]